MNLKSKHQQEFKNIKYSLFLSVATIAILGGCKSANDRITVEPALTRPKVLVSRLDAPITEGLFFLRGDNRIYLGELEQNMDSLVPAPAEATTFYEEAPVVGDQYQAHGWQNKKEAFAAVYLRNRLVLGLHTLNNVSQGQVESIVEEYTRAFAPTSLVLVPAQRGVYWFWNRGRSRLMISTSEDKLGVQSVAIAIGDTEIMNGLRMTEASARQDLFEAARILAEPHK